MASPHRNIPTLVGLAAEAVSNKDFETVAKTVDTPMLQKWHDAQYHRHEVAADRYLQDLEFVMNDFSAWEGETTRSPSFRGTSKNRAGSEKESVSHKDGHSQILELLCSSTEVQKDHLLTAAVGQSLSQK